MRSPKAELSLWSETKTLGRKGLKEEERLSSVAGVVPDRSAKSRSKDLELTQHSGAELRQL